MRLPKINQKVSLRIISGAWEGLYSTYVEGLDSQVLTVAVPMYGGGNLLLPKDEEILVEFIDGGDRLAFPTRVLGHLNQVVPLLALAAPAPGSVRIHQQREFVRLNANLSVSYALLLPETAEKEKGAQKLLLRGRTMDVSGSGAQIVTPEAYPTGSRLELLLHLQGGDVPIEAVVVRVAQQPNPKEYWLGVRFVKMEERDRERIVRFIFSEQRARRQKGLL